MSDGTGFVEALRHLEDVDRETPEEPELLPIDKMTQAYELHMRGIPTRAIASQFGVDQSTIHRWKKKLTEMYREQLETVPAADIIADHLHFLDNLERLHLYEASQVTRDGSIIDAATGEVLSGNDPIKAKKLKLEYLRAAGYTRRMKMDLEVTCGLIPKEPERIYHAMEEEKRRSITDDARKAERTAEEIKQSILQLLSKTRSIA